MISINLNDIIILDIEGVDYCCMISKISKSNAVYLMKNADLTKDIEVLQK